MAWKKRGFGLLTGRRQFDEQARARGTVRRPAARAEELERIQEPAADLVTGVEPRREYEESCHFSCHPFDWVPVDVYDPDGTNLPAALA